jgi:hypothetical protein
MMNDIPIKKKPAAAPPKGPRSCGFCGREKAPGEKAGMCGRCREERDLLLAEDGVRARPCPAHGWQFLAVDDDGTVECRPPEPQEPPTNDPRADRPARTRATSKR